VSKSIILILLLLVLEEGHNFVHYR